MNHSSVRSHNTKHRSHLLTLALALAGTAAHAQTIFNVSERADAGEAVAISGNGLATASRVAVVPILEGKEGVPLSANITYQDSSEIVALLPRTAPFGIYRIAVTTAAGTSNSLYVNRPRAQWIDTTTAAAGESVRVVGRNLYPSNVYAPKVRLQSVKNGAYISAAVTSSDNEQLIFKVPATAAAGTSYRVFVDNGLPGAASEINTGYTLTMGTPGTDPFNLGTTWADDFAPMAANVYDMKSDARLKSFVKGDGKTDDTAAVQAAIKTAYSAGGGTVYLPAGTYRLDGGGTANSLTLYPKVVLRGAGIGKTIVQVGYNYTPAKAPPASAYWLYMKEPGQNGLKDVTVQNLNTSATANKILRQGLSSGNINRLFVADVDFQMGNGDTILLTYLNRSLVTRCKFVSTCPNHEPVRLTNSTLTRIQNNVFNYRSGRLALSQGDRNIFEGNTVLIDNGNSDPKDETGGIELSLSNRTMVCDNTIAGYNGTRRKDVNDGELIMSQNNVADFTDTGTVASATSNGISPAGESWPTSPWLSSIQADTQRTAVAIVSGKGKGQWRWITDHTANSLTTDAPWDVIPDSTSSYAITCVTNYQQTYLRNHVENGRVGISVYGGAFDTIVDSNVLVNTGVLALRADARIIPVGGVPLTKQLMVWNCSVCGNTVENTNGYTTAAISAYTITADGAGLGTSLLNTDIRNNNVIGGNGSERSYVGINDGYEVFAMNAKNGATSLPILGTILSGNSITGSMLPYRMAYCVACPINGVLTSSVDVAALRAK